MVTTADMIHVTAIRAAEATGQHTHSMGSNRIVSKFFTIFQISINIFGTNKKQSGSRWKLKKNKNRIKCDSFLAETLV